MGIIDKDYTLGINFGKFFCILFIFLIANLVHNMNLYYYIPNIHNLF